MKLLFHLKQISLLTVTALIISFNGCSRNPATGERHFNIISESQEIQMGKEADQQIVTSMGLYPDQNLQNYIQQLGQTLASKSERANLQWTFRVIDDPVVNAFALPGGYIYVTRGILSHLENEAELAGVIGHEIGHVTAKHSVYRLSSQQLTQLGVGLAMVLKPELQQYSQLASLGLGLMFLKFSRDDEREADELGVRYMTRDSYDPTQMVEVMKMLGNVSSQAGGERVPQWLSTHPDPENRVQLLNQEISKTTLPQNPKVSKEEYLTKLDNMIYGVNPRDGFVVGNTFYQPDMKFFFTFPSGWQIVNQKQAVIGVSANQDAIIQISLSDQKSADAAANQFFSQQGISASGITPTNINGMKALTGNFAANTDQGALAGNATFITYGGNTFQILSYGGGNVWAGYTPQVMGSVQSFNELKDQKYLNVQPQRMKIITINTPMTISQFNSAHPSSVDLKTLALINQTDENTQFPAGSKLKQITGTGLPK